MDSIIIGSSIVNNEIVRSVNNLKDDITIAAGDNIAVTISDDSLIISSTISGSGNTLDQAYDEGGPGLGRSIIADAGAFEVNGVDGALFSGTYNNGIIPAEGAGTRMMWYPAKAAFRAGSVSGAQWDDANIGQYSIGVGNNVTASNSQSIAFGDRTSASGIGSIAFGSMAQASGNYSSAFGLETIASGYNSLAVGREIESSGQYSVAIALNDQNGTTVAQNNTMSVMGGNVGIGTTTPSTALEVADTIYASVGGFKFPDGSVQTSAASGSGNGDITGVTAGNGLSGGGLSGDVTLNADFAGTGVTNFISRSDHHHDAIYVNEGQANSVSSTMIVNGTVNVSDLQDGTALSEIADDDGPGSGLNADYLDNLHASSFMSATTDNWVNTTGDIMTGRLTNNSNDGVLFTGTFGNGTIPATGAGTRMMWYPRKAAFRAGFVDGSQWDDTNIGIYSVAMGRYTTASGVNSLAIGYNSKAYGDYCTAFGNNNQAEDDHSVAMGVSSTANGFVSIALGNTCFATGDITMAMGLWNQAYAYASHAFGRYNYYNTSHNQTSWVDQEYILTIGDGTAATNRSNSLTFSKNGYMWIQGTLTQNSDQNLKQNIQPLNNAIQNLQQIKGISYQWKNTEQMGNQTEIGVIAQDVEKVYPELVGENEGYKTTNYTGLIPVLIEAVKEQQKLIEQLQQRISELENK